MNLQNTPESYGSITKTFHWLMAVLIIFMLCLGFVMGEFGDLSTKLKLFGLHKSTGITILSLAVLRIFWHVYSQKPGYVASLKDWEKKLASLVHYALYGFMIVMPLSGWLLSSAAGRPVSFFGLFTLPDLIGPDQNLKEFFEEAHEIMVWPLMLVIAAHVAAAFKHHVIDKDATLRRMLPAVALALLLAGATPVLAAAPQWKMIDAESSLGFTGKVMGKEFSGAFKKFSADILFDADHLDQSKVKVTIDTASLDSADKERDDTAKGKDFFDVTTFSNAVFDSTAFSKKPDGSFEVAGNLTIRDVTLPLTIPFTLSFSKDDSGKERAVMKGSVSIDRSQFKLGQGEWADTSTVAKDITVNIAVAAVK